MSPLQEADSLREENARLVRELSGERARSAVLARALRRYRGVAAPAMAALLKVDLSAWPEPVPAEPEDDDAPIGEALFTQPAVAAAAE